MPDDRGCYLHKQNDSAKQDQQGGRAQKEFCDNHGHDIGKLSFIRYINEKTFCSTTGLTAWRQRPNRRLRAPQILFLAPLASVRTQVLADVIEHCRHDASGLRPETSWPVWPFPSRSNAVRLHAGSLNHPSWINPPALPSRHFAIASTSSSTDPAANSQPFSPEITSSGMPAT